MKRTLIWTTIVLLTIFVTKAKAQRPFSHATSGQIDYYKECADQLDIDYDLTQQQSNRTNILCLQKCVFEKDGTIDSKGVIMKSALMDFLFDALFNSNKQKINFFNQCVSNLLPSGIIKNCWDIDKFIYCIVSNAESEYQHMNYNTFSSPITRSKKPIQVTK